MSIKPQCPICKGEIIVEYEYEGITIRCKECGEVLPINYVLKAIATQQRIEKIDDQQIYGCMHPHGEYIDASYGCMLQVNNILNFIKGEVG